MKRSTNSSAISSKIPNDVEVVSSIEVAIVVYDPDNDSLFPGEELPDNISIDEGHTAPFQKKRLPILPNDYRKNKNISLEEKKSHSERLLQAREMKRSTFHPISKKLSTKSTTYNSHNYFNNLLSQAQTNLRSLLKTERNRGTVSSNDRKEIFSIQTLTYFNYLVVYKKLNEIYDQMVHPQKNLLVRKLLDMILSRLLEIRVALVTTENSEFYYFDELAYLEKIPPNELEVPIPNFYFHDPPPRLVLRDQWYETIKERKAHEAEERLLLEQRIQTRVGEEVGGVKWTKKKTISGGVNDVDIFGLMGSTDEGPYFDQASLILIQTMERARQGILRYRLAKYLHDEEVRATMRKHKAKKKHMEVDKAIVIIQKLVRGFLARVRVSRMREEELELLGLVWTTPNTKSIRGRAQLKCIKDEEELETSKQERRLTRRRHQKLFEDAQTTIYNKIKLLEAPNMAEEFKFQLRSWMLNVKETTGKLPVAVPKAEFGGSKFFICPNQISEQVREKSKESTSKKDSAKKKKERKKEKERKKKEKGGSSKGSKKEVGGEPLIPKLDPASNLDDLIACNIEYNKVWRGRDESQNPLQKHEEQFIIHEKRCLIGEEVREQVDIALKGELHLLKQALERKKGKKGKGKKGKGKKGKGKKGKKKKKGKGKDMTPDRSIESLFEELLDNEIIKKYPKLRMDALVGSCSLINGEIRSFFGQNNPLEANKPGGATSSDERPMPGDANPSPSFGDVKRAVKDICILPLGSEAVHLNSPHTKSVLICGPEGSGKKALVTAICTELHATLFDLTAANIAGKYPGKPGLKMLMHLIDKVGRAVSPVIIKIDNCEKAYVKKTAKTDKTEPKRLKKQLGKLLKTFIPGDQMLLIGLSSEPWQCPFKPLKKDFQKIIYIPRPDYGTRIEIWRSLLLPYSEFLHQDVNFCLLAKLSDGWTAGILIKVSNFVISMHEKLLKKDEHDKKHQDDEDPLMMIEGKKISSVGKRLIRINQFLEELSNYDPVFLEQDRTWNLWFNKTPLQKARLSSQSAIGEVKEKKKKKGKKKGKSKKGKKK